MMCTKHEKEKAKMQATIEKLQEAFCDKESKLQVSKELKVNIIHFSIIDYEMV